ncbi:MurR/RpiR family transcriptional regulator [Bradyrhizobium elkanii]|jgi:DNA-binding MurR/RpiR family transcriptional regulator|uniref:MurR/RpiR family transcriptional regulator n=1 Tax=Bradyrhizobium elkanii TaxID=29448 RepID=UPI00144A248A|nr:DNA-binding MurR/RpiR family transcriptional regulator [Bradyrhizobium elkanii]MCS3581585.1 DNA-binding MurR/RpiR family transcriptional regulator [Bradyrhizobium elkanii]MCS3724459.1 DNA-binding MurR/RpiR family transcriptional regulator [Bradyrhizobium elkanii]MCS4008871.1 DNA-binding MurR/RpiR family transcriptional regulator [Bradyrhizobium elkanii USDA 61]BBB94742.1 RpiR family transcriptional regulator [Bradyrhizobium elkanii USDA 61]
MKCISVGVAANSRGRSDAHYRALPLVNAHLSTLPRALRRIATYVSENPNLVVRQTAKDLAVVTKSGPASIIRFCQAIGFSGLQEFKLALAGDIAAQHSPVVEKNAKQQASVSLMDQLTERIVLATRETQCLLDQAALDRLANAMLSARRIDVYGVAACGPIAQHLVFRLLRIGIPAHAILDTTYAAYVASGLGPTSAAIAISGSRMTKETVAPLMRAKSAGAFTAVITHRSDGPAVKYADEVLLTAGVHSPVAEPNSVIAFTNLIAIEVLASMLAVKQHALTQEEPNLTASGPIESVTTRGSTDVPRRRPHSKRCVSHTLFGVS